MIRRLYRLKPRNPLRKPQGARPVHQSALKLFLVAALAAAGTAPEALAFKSEGRWPVSCLDDIARQTQVSPTLLQAIVFVESRGHPWAININARSGAHAIVPRTEAEARQIVRALASTSSNFDVGLAQINSRQFRALGVEPEALLDPCRNLLAAGTILKQLIHRYGESWTAVMRYNGKNPAYAWRVRSAWQAFLAADPRQSK